MKAGKILIFIVSIALALGLLWLLFPAGGVKVSDGLTLRFPSYAKALSDTAASGVEAVDVDEILKKANESLDVDVAEVTKEADSTTQARRFSETIKDNGNRIYVPGDDYTYFDPVFRAMELAAARDTIVRVMHYGDSQIEMDRITAILRERLQERFGGSGPSMVPAVQAIPTVSVRQGWSGGLTRYTMYGDSTTRRAPHRRYGVLCQFSQLGGEAVVTFSQTKHRYAQPRAKRISRVGLLVGRTSAGFSASLRCDTLARQEKTLPEAVEGVSLLTWELPQDIVKGSLTLRGSGEVYALTLDGGAGVAVDNDALRGCAGYIFSRIDSTVMRESFKALNTKMIILEFGGNAIGGIYSTKAVNAYTERIASQIRYFRSVNPGAAILFIGPSDMSKSVDGTLRTYPHLSELNDSLKVTCLRENAAYWDLFTMMGGENSMISWVNHSPAYAGPDHIHFTTQGANYVGEVLSKSFLLYHDYYRQRVHGEPLPTLDKAPGDSLSVAQ